MSFAMQRPHWGFPCKGFLSRLPHSFGVGKQSLVTFIQTKRAGMRPETRLVRAWTRTRNPRSTAIADLSHLHHICARRDVKARRLHESRQTSKC